MSENLYRKVTAEEIEYEKQESRYRFMLDMNTMKSVAEEKGLAKGLERGRAEGEKLGIERGVAQTQREIAKNMKALKISLDNIAQATGLSLAEIEAL